MSKAAPISKEDQEYIDKNMTSTASAAPVSDMKRIFINLNSVDANKKKIPVNTFNISGTDIYLEELNIRPLGFYSKFMDEKQVTGKDGKKSWKPMVETVLYTRGEEAYDTQGTTNCGKVSRKNIPASWTEVQKAANRDKARYYGFLFGLVDIPGSDPVYAMARLPSAKALAVNQALFDAKVSDKALYKYRMKLTLQPKNGTVHPDLEVSIDTSKELPVSDVVEFHKKMTSFVTTHNNRIMQTRGDKHDTAVQNKTDQEVLDELAGDFDE